MNVAATKTRNRRSVPFRGGQYVASLMAELSRVAIAQRIQTARKEAGVDQRELADALHVHWRTVQNWESQKRPITPWDRLGELGHVLGVSRDWLIHGDHQDHDPEDAARARFADAVAGLQEGQQELLEALETTREDVVAQLAQLCSVLSRLEDSLSIPQGQRRSPDTGG